MMLKNNTSIVKIYIPMIILDYTLDDVWEIP